MNYVRARKIKKGGEKVLTELRRQEIAELLADTRSKKMAVSFIYSKAQSLFGSAIATQKDSTGILIKSKLVNRLASVILNSNYAWAHIEPPALIKSKVTENDKRELQDQTKAVFDDIQHLSNFELEKVKILNDYLVGTTVFKVEYTGDYRRPTRFRSAPLENVYVLEGEDSRATTVFYKNEKMKRNNIISLWKEAEAIGEIEKDKEYTVWEVTTYNRKTSKFDYVVALDEAFTKIIKFEELEESEWVVGRWEPFISNNPYGIGPCSKAVMEMMNLKFTKSSLNKIRDFTASPMMISYGDERIAKAMKFMPGMNAYGGAQEGHARFVPLSTGMDPNIDFFNLQEHKDILNDLFYVDFMSAIKNVDDLKNVTATATQIAVTKFAEQIDPIYSRMQKEILEQIVRKVRNNNLRANIISNKNIEFLKEGTRFDVRFHNMLTMAQDQDNIERNNMFIQDIVGKFGPQTGIAMINANKYIDSSADRYRITREDFTLGEELEAKLMEIQENSVPPPPEGAV